MPSLENSRHEKFANLVASGMSASEAYGKAGYTEKDGNHHGPRLMANDGVRKRVAELKEAQSQKSELSRDQLREFLIELILTPAGTVNEKSRLCQSYKVTAEAREIRMPDKLRAAEQLSKLCGCQVERHEIDFKQQKELVEVLARMRGAGAATRNNQSAG
jgi:Terminase small subunit